MSQFDGSTPGPGQFYDQEAAQPSAVTVPSTPAPTMPTVPGDPTSSGQFTPPAPARFGQPAGTDPGLGKPWYGIGFLTAFKRAFQKYATFSGRASRGEYWWYWLGTVIVAFVLGLLSIPGIDWDAYLHMVYGGYTGGDAPMNAFGVVVAIITALWGLAIIVPGLALVWRRLHDTNRSGGWFFITLIPLVGPIILLVFLATQTYRGSTRWDQ